MPCIDSILEANHFTPEERRLGSFIVETLFESSQKKNKKWLTFEEICKAVRKSLNYERTGVTYPNLFIKTVLKRLEDTKAPNEDPMPQICRADDKWACTTYLSKGTGGNIKINRF